MLVYDMMGSLFHILRVLCLFTCSISPNIREGLLEAFYGVYEKDPDKVSENYADLKFVSSETFQPW